MAMNRDQETKRGKHDGFRPVPVVKVESAGKPSDVSTDQSDEFERQMNLGRRSMRKHRAVLAALAK